MSDKKKILYVQTSGVDNPERAYAPFILATTAAMMNIDATVYFLIKGVTLVKKGEAEKKESIIFTSGATESNNLAIKGVAGRYKDKGKRVLTSSIEHISVVNPVK